MGTSGGNIVWEWHLWDHAGCDVGTRTAVDVLDSLRETYRAQRDYAGSRYDYILSTLRLRQAAGLLGDDHLFEINRWLIQP